MKDFDYIVPDAISQYNILIKAYAKNGGDNTLDSIFNLVKEAYNAKRVSLDSIFQWQNIVFIMLRVAWRYGGSQENDQEIQRNMMMAHLV